MQLFYRLVRFPVIRRFIERCRVIDIRQSLTTMLIFLLLSFFTSAVVNILLPILFTRNSPSSLSTSSLSLLTSSHVFFPSDLTSLQCSSQSKSELQTHRTREGTSNSEKKYTKDQSTHTNVSSGKKGYSSFDFHSYSKCFPFIQIFD